MNKRLHRLRRAKQAVQDGQFIAELLRCYLQKVWQLQDVVEASPPSLPPGPAPPPFDLRKFVVSKGVWSFPKGPPPQVIQDCIQAIPKRQFPACPKFKQNHSSSLTKFVSLLDENLSQKSHHLHASHFAAD